MNTIYLVLLMLGQVLDISLPSKLEKKISSFEPSAALYLSDLDTFLIASDDTTKKDEAMLFLMNAQGEVEEEPLTIDGLNKITDIESVSMDGHGFLYVMSSLGLNKNGKLKSERNLFVRAERQDREIQAVDEMDLRTPLIEAMENEHHGVIADMSGRFEAELDVESHFTSAGKLFVGLKGEGLAIRPESNQVMIVFDEGGAPAKYVFGSAP